MFKKLTALVFAGIMTVGVVAAAAPPVAETPQQTQRRLDNYMNACRAAYIEWRYSSVRMPGTDTYVRMSAEEAMKKATSRFPESERFIVTLLCVGYGEGYEDGRRGTA